MKYSLPIYAIFILVLLVLLTTNAFAGSIEPNPWAGQPNSVKPVVYTECQAGHLFVIAASSNGVAIMQMFKDAGDMVPKPIECETNENQ